MVERMIGQLKEMLGALKSDPDLFALAASGMKKMHEELVKAGFTKEQATQIVAGQGMGLGVKGS